MPVTVSKWLGVVVTPVLGGRFSVTKNCPTRTSHTVAAAIVWVRWPKVIASPTRRLGPSPSPRFSRWLHRPRFEHRLRDRPRTPPSRHRWHRAQAAEWGIGTALARWSSRSALGRSVQARRHERLLQGEPLPAHPSLRRRVPRSVPAQGQPEGAGPLWPVPGRDAEQGA